MVKNRHFTNYSARAACSQVVGVIACQQHFGRSDTSLLRGVSLRYHVMRLEALAECVQLLIKTSRIIPKHPVPHIWN